MTSGANKAVLSTLLFSSFLLAIIKSIVSQKFPSNRRQDCRPIAYALSEIWMSDITVCSLYSEYLHVVVTTVYSVLPVISFEICESVEALLLE